MGILKEDEFVMMKYTYNIHDGLLIEINNLNSKYINLQFSNFNDKNINKVDKKLTIEGKEIQKGEAILGRNNKLSFSRNKDNFIITYKNNSICLDGSIPLKDQNKLYVEDKV